MKHLHPLQAVSLAIAVITLSACGGGGDNAPTVPSTTDLQGIWQSASGAATSTSAIVLPNGTVWAVLSNGAVTRLIKASLTAKATGFEGSGKSFTLGTSTVTNLNASATLVAKSSGTFTITDTSTGQSEPYALSYQTRYDTPAVLADHAGNWQATLGPGVISWSINASGALSGTRTTGCTYSGQVSLRQEQKAVVDVLVNETCSGALTVLQGVGALSTDKTRLSLVMTTPNDAAGVAVNLVH